MGYELDRLLARIGVADPSVGSAPKMGMPAAPTTYGDPTVDARNQQLYSDAMAQQEAAFAPHKAAYDQYANDYVGRVAGTSMYGPTLQLPTLQRPRADLQGLSVKYEIPAPALPGAFAAADKNSGAGDGDLGAPAPGQLSGYDRNSLTGGLAGAALGFGGVPNASIPVDSVGTYAGVPGPNDFGAATQAEYDAISAAQAAANNAVGYSDIGSTSSDTGVGNPGESTGPTSSESGVGNPGESYGGYSSDSSSGSDGSSSGEGTDSGGDGWARGGRVRRNFSAGGLNDLASQYDLPTPGQLPSITPDNAQQQQPPAVMPQQANPLQDLLAKYGAGPQSSVYADELKAARATAGRETEAFNSLLERALSGEQDTAPSKAEMYFRLAAAFGAPTKTGNFTENLSLAGKELADDAKARRDAAKADRNAKLQLSITGQKAKMDSAKDDLATLRTLTGEEMKDARALTTKVMETYIKSGEPESAAGKQAKDEGLRVGTPQYQARVKAIAEMNVEKQMASVNATIAQMGVAQAQLALAQGKFGLQQDLAAKLTPAELKLKSETEDLLTSSDAALLNLKRAYALNPKSFDSTLKDKAQRLALEQVRSDDPRVLASREMENLLSRGAVEKLRASFGGNPTEGERAILLSLEGIEAKSRAERSKIIMNAYEALKIARAKQAKRLNEIQQGLYRNTDAGGIGDGN